MISFSPVRPAITRSAPSLLKVNNNNSVNKPANICKITFSGNKRNVNQSLLIAPEMNPYSMEGGLGHVVRDYPLAFNDLPPIKEGKLDLRVMIPLYNANSDGPKKDKDGNLIFERSDKVDPKTGKKLIWKLEDTGIKTDYSIGVNKSWANLYKIKNPGSPTTTYAVYSPGFNKLTKAYSEKNFYQNMKYYSRYCAAAVNLLDKMNDSSEKFNPKTIQAIDANTGFAVKALKNQSEVNGNYSDIKSIEQAQNIGHDYQGKCEPHYAALNLFSEKETNILLNDKRYNNAIQNLIHNNQDRFQGLQWDPNDTTKQKKVLSHLNENFEEILDQPKNHWFRNELNESVRGAFPHGALAIDQSGDYNTLAMTLKDADAWTTCSPTYYNEIKDTDKYSRDLHKHIVYYGDKGVGILDAIDPTVDDMSDPGKVKFPYTVNNFVEQKEKNKEYILSQFSEDNILNKKIDRELINNQDTAIIKGYIDPNLSKKGPLFFAMSRGDMEQKGIDIVLESTKKILDKDPDAKFMFAWPRLLESNENKKIVDNFFKDIDKHKGRVVLIDSFVQEPRRYLAGSDFSLYGSRFEPCGVAQYSSLRAGSPPIVPKTGGFNDIIKYYEKNMINSTGYKTPESLNVSKNPVQDFTNTILKALNTYKKDKPVHDNIVKNCMEYDVSWKKSAGQYLDLIIKVSKGLLPHGKI